MIKTPLKLMRKSATTPIFFIFMICLSYFLMLLFVFPCKISCIVMGFSFHKWKLVHYWHYSYKLISFLLFSECFQRPWISTKTKRCSIPCIFVSHI